MAEKTRYHVFREIDAADTKAYEPIAAAVEAHSSGDALRQAVKETGTYVAVPARSFDPTHVTIETQTVVKVGA